MNEYYCLNCQSEFTEFEQTTHENNEGVCPNCGEYRIVETNGIKALVKYPNMPLNMKFKLLARMINRGKDNSLKILAEQCGLNEFLGREKFKSHYGFKGLELRKWR